MRARGAKVTDIAVVVVAADDGVMRRPSKRSTTRERPRCRSSSPSTRSTSRTPIRIASRTAWRKPASLLRSTAATSQWWPCPRRPASAGRTAGNDHALGGPAGAEGQPKRPAVGTIVEAELDKGRGPVATALVSTGTLRVGDVIVVGETYGKVRALENEHGKRITKAGPSTPAVVLGLADVLRQATSSGLSRTRRSPGPSWKSERSRLLLAPKAPARPLLRICTLRSRRPDQGTPDHPQDGRVRLPWGHHSRLAAALHR